MPFSVSFKSDGAVGPGFLEITVAGAEVVVQRSFLPDSVFLASLDEVLDIEVGENFEKENAAKQRQQKFLVHDDG